MDFARIAPAMNALSEAPIYIDDTPNIRTMELRTKARRLQAEAGLDLVIVDYLQLMQATTDQPRRQPRPGGVGDLARTQGARARAVGPGHRARRSSPASRRCASRRSRGCRTCASRARSSRTPTSSCSCGARRSAAGDEQEPDGEVINLKLAKHRNGPTGEIQLWFKKSQTRFVLLRRRALRRA